MTASRSFAVLKQGSQGSEVKRIQSTLNAWLQNQEIIYGKLLVEDGMFGSQTERVVKFFQCRHLLEIDGIVGAETMGCLERGAHSLPLLKQGSSGPMVKRVQNVLKLYGIELTVDGIYGPKTRAAIVRFQNDYHIYDQQGQASGEINLNTWIHLLQEPTAIACGPIKQFRG